jgi:hypothetical protein
MTAPKASASVAAEPTVILSGYEIVGCDPQFSPDGSLLAFSARPVDHSAGPDVFLWRVGQEAAEPVTSRHGDLLGGWYGQQMLVSEISAGGGSGDAATTSGGTAAVGTTSYIFDTGDRPPDAAAGRGPDRQVPHLLGRHSQVGSGVGAVAARRGKSLLRQMVGSRSHTGIARAGRHANRIHESRRIRSADSCRNHDADTHTDAAANPDDGADNIAGAHGNCGCNPDGRAQHGAGDRVRIRRGNQ